jgi:arylsulfatase
MLDKIKNHQDDGKPMFMYLSFQVSHSPFQAPQEFMKKYEGVYDVGYDKIKNRDLRNKNSLEYGHEI